MSAAQRCTEDVRTRNAVWRIEKWQAVCSRGGGGPPRDRTHRDPQTSVDMAVWLDLAGVTLMSTDPV
jgi:hypothetical protein